jgi:hypothetical protein
VPVAVPAASAGASFSAFSAGLDSPVHPELTIRARMSIPIKIIFLNLILEIVFMLLSSSLLKKKYYINLTKFFC